MKQLYLMQSIIIYLYLFIIYYYLYCYSVMNKNMKHFLLELLYTSRLILTRDGTIPVWDKKGTPFCHSCDRSFGWLTFKHHCRNISFLFLFIF